MSLETFEVKILFEYMSFFKLWFKVCNMQKTSCLDDEKVLERQI